MGGIAHCPAQIGQAQFAETLQRIVGWRIGHDRRDLGAEMERLGVERARLLSDNIELDTRAGELSTSIAAVEGELAELTAAEAELRADLAAMDEELKRFRAQMQGAHERRSQYEVELVRKQSELKYLDETSRNELGLPVSELASGDETVPDDLLLAEAE